MPSGMSREYSSKLFTKFTQKQKLVTPTQKKKMPHLIKKKHMMIRLYFTLLVTKYLCSDACAYHSQVAPRLDENFVVNPASDGHEND